MKKLTIFLTAAAMVALISCNGGSKTETVVDTAAVQQITTEIQSQVDSLAKDFGNQTMAHYGAIIKGDVKLSDKEKMVKPEYFVSPKTADVTATLIQKYRLLGVMSVDYNMAKMYNNDVTDYENAMLKIIYDLCDPAISNFRENLKSENSVDEIPQHIGELYQDEVKNNRLVFFWEYNGAVTIEATYILAHNTDQMISSFNDEDVAKLTKRFSILIDCVNRLVPYMPEMTSLQKSLAPLSNFNATNVVQLKTQLFEQKEQIEKSRTELLRFLSELNEHE